MRTLIRKIPHILTILKKIGFLKLFSFFFEHYIFSYQKRYVFFKVLSDDQPMPRPSEFEFRLATLDDAEQLEIFSYIYSTNEMKKWMIQGDFLFLAFLHGKPIAFQYLSKKSRTFMPHSKFPLQEGQLWVVDIYTLPEYRIKHVASLLREYREWYLGKYGIKETIGSIAENNLPSMLYTQSGSFRMIQYFIFIRFFLFTYFHLEPDARIKYNECIKKLRSNIKK